MYQDRVQEKNGEAKEKDHMEIDELKNGVIPTSERIKMKIQMRLKVMKNHMLILIVLALHQMMIFFS